ncbi:E3 ubiquitin-protein ligase SHPRH [Fasciola gigantica]|uniref:E3 ubiquitin-protein ligase SHPRH n=1 Tax=Fasciola gigantica TaxID=46835 RepID=A0A504YZH3_FASGI|nr:E3 ubiquitin-protein ligase SHPRH [Fasciola gigantica]
MRTKALPSFLSLNTRKQICFTYHGKIDFTSLPGSSKTHKKGRRRATLTCEQRELMARYPHFINLSASPASEDLLIHTLSFPIGFSTLAAINSDMKLQLFFDKKSLLFLMESQDIVREFIITGAERLTPLLFAASCSQFEVHYHISNEIMHLDICLKPRCLLTSDELQTRPAPLQQYEKVLDFLTLQLLDGDAHYPPLLKEFVYGTHTETQPEFICLVRLLYDCAQTYHEATRSLWDRPDLFVQNMKITATLRPYQIDAVKWMVYREMNSFTVDKEELFDYLFRPIKLGPGERTVYFSLLTGTFSEDLPVLKDPCLGGVLADEMGLGKTLEVMTLILQHPWSDWDQIGGTIRGLDGEVLPPEKLIHLDHIKRNTPDASRHVLCSCGDAEETRDFATVQCISCCGPWQHATCVQYNPEEYFDKLPIKYGYICPNCWSQLRVDSKATLIVAPDHIWQQWKEELQTHILHDSVDVLLYAGMEAPATRVQVGVRTAVQNAQSKNNPYAPRTRVPARFMTATQHDEDVNELLPGFVQPCQLACADIVLTSYSVVQRELDWAEVIAERRAGMGDRPQLRLAQRYICRPSPLTCVRWWRVCLDEAQMVERVTSKTARMLFQIDAVHRWCVTGTPAERSIDDLYGLFAYLRFEPFCSSHYWNSLLYQPFLAATTQSWLQRTGIRDADADGDATDTLPTIPESTRKAVQSSRLASVLSLILWRNTKRLVGSQLVLPPITEQVHWVSFTPVERYIHDRVLAQSIGALKRLLHTMSISPDQPLASLPGAVHWRLVYLITRLRQACTHASLVVATGGGGVGSQPKSSGRRGGGRRAVTHSGPHRSLTYEELDETVDPDEMDTDRFTQSSSARSGPSASAARAQRHIGTGCFTMTEVIRRVVDDTRRECEGLLRTWAFNKNGAAGCFIIKEEYIQAADCYRDVLRTANSLEKRHGVLTDWSQRLHAITNLHWLIQSRDVPLSDEPALTDPVRAIELSSSDSIARISVETDRTSGTQSEVTDLDPRVDRDLIAKAERLRIAYIQSHSHLLARVHESLGPIVAELDNELSSTMEADSVESTMFCPVGVSWLGWLSDALDLLASCGLGSSLIDMLVSSFQGLPNGSRHTYRTTLLYVGSMENFKLTLLAEVSSVFNARKQLRAAMEPLTSTWKSFAAGEPVDQRILRQFYSCCARAAETDENESTITENQDPAGPTDAASPRKRKREESRTRELKQLTADAVTRKPRKRTRCAYCTAVRALRQYQDAVNCERTGSRTGARDSVDDKADRRLGTLEPTFDENEDSGTGLMRNNPLLVAIVIVCHQVVRVLSSDQSPKTPFPVSVWRQRAKRFEQLFRQMGKEIILTSRSQSLTKEWWNIHDDTEQFVIRLQATCPTDLAFIHSQEVDAQLQSYIVDATVVWPRLQSRLGHFSFLRNAHLAAVTGAGSKDSKGTDGPDSQNFRLECPTCLQPHSPSNPTFALLPGCWHALCIQCHNRIASSGQLSQRRCPICRTPFNSNETTGINARRRRPLTLIHYTDGKHESEREDSEKSASTHGDSSGTRVDEDTIPIVGDHSSKVQSVIRCLMQIKQEDPDAKAIVFSSWLSVLVTIAGAMEQNGLSYTTLFKARDACCPGRLAGFQCMGSATWVLLMPIQLGANGLNLTSANHVLLVDPVLSHGREAQAVARIHRIGQTRPSIVHRFLVMDSIEAALHTAHVRSQSDNSLNGEDVSSVECMIGAGVRRTSSSSYGVASPSEDKAQLMSMTIGQLAELLHVENNTAMLIDEQE